MSSMAVVLSVLGVNVAAMAALTGAVWKLSRTLSHMETNLLKSELEQREWTENKIRTAFLDHRRDCPVLGSVRP